MTLRQPTERHGGTARFDEVTVMVSKTLQSLDRWLAEAEEVLAEQTGGSKAEAQPEIPTHGRPVQLYFDLGDV